MCRRYAGKNYNFSREIVNSVGSNAVGCSSRANAVIDFFCCVQCSIDSYCFSVSWTTSKNCPFPWRIWTPGSLSPLESPNRTASRYIHPFWQGSQTWQTDGQLHIPRYSVCNNGPHIVAMRPSNSNSNSKRQLFTTIWHVRTSKY